MRRLLVLLALIATSLVVAAPPASARDGGYWMLTQDGRIFGFGGALKLGEALAFTVPRADVEATPSGNGYWILGSNGAIHEFGDAKWLGSGTNTPLAPGEVFVSMSATPTGGGYWLFTSKGRVLAFGNAQFFGDMSGTPLNGSVLGSVATPSGQGYWMVASDGGIFSFGDAKFYGSMGDAKLNKPVMSMAPDPDGAGYWLVASDGGIFAFQAPFYGSTGNLSLAKPISGMVASPTGRGYLMVAEDGGIFSFGDVPFHGSLGANPPNSPVVAVAAIGSRPDPVFSTKTVLDHADIGSQVSPPFTLQGGQTAAMGWSCGDTVSGEYTAGCLFTVREYASGQQVDYVSGSRNGVGTLYLHPETTAQFYVEADEFSVNDDTVWAVVIQQPQCVQYCD